MSGFKDAPASWWFRCFFLDSSNICQLGYICIDLYRKSIWNKCCTLVIFSNSSHTPNGDWNIYLRIYHTFRWTCRYPWKLTWISNVDGLENVSPLNMASFWYEPRKMPWLVGLYRGLCGDYFINHDIRIKINRFSPGRGMWYSYKTCGGKDYWMTPEKKKELQVRKVLRLPPKKIRWFCKRLHLKPNKHLKITLKPNQDIF